VTENWKPIPGWGDLYEVSDLGRIRSVRRKGSKGGVLKTPITTSGYPEVNLCRDGKVTHFQAHYLVVLAFHGERPSGMECRHLNGDRSDNRAANLAWGTSSENNRDRVRHGTWTNKFVDATHCKHGHELTEENIRWGISSRGQPFRLCMVCRRRRNKEQAARRLTARQNARDASWRP
jgi:hypothetical protein